MAERLTNSCKEIPTLCDNAEYWLQVYFKLKDYEDSGFTPEEIAIMAKFYKEHTSVETITANMKIAAKLIKLGKYEKLEEQGRLIELPCKIGDTVYLRACCEIVLTSHDYETGTSECPFEDDCEFKECSNSNERIFRTSIQSIWNDGFDWKFTVKGLYIDFPLKDIGRYIFLTKEEAEAALNGRMGKD